MVDRHLFESRHGFLVKHRACIQGNFVGPRNQNRLGQHTAQHAFAQRFDHIAALNQRRHRNAVTRLAIDFRNDKILGDIDKPTRQVPGVRGLQRGIGQTFTGAMRRDEVLQYIKTFTEIRRDRGLDDRTIGLGH